MLKGIIIRQAVKGLDLFDKRAIFCLKKRQKSKGRWGYEDGGDGLEHKAREEGVV